MIKTIWITLFLLVITSGGRFVSAAVPNNDKPNIVVIFIGDRGFADSSCFGNPLMNTPHIDQLAKEGIQLSIFYVNSPIYSASRVAITTGQYHGHWKKFILS